MCQGCFFVQGFKAPGSKSHSSLNYTISNILRCPFSEKCCQRLCIYIVTTLSDQASPCRSLVSWLPSGFGFAVFRLS